MVWRAFPLHPETPEQGQSLEELFRGRGVDIPAMLERLRQVAASEGLPFGDRTMTFNSRPAQELGKWAEDAGRGQAYHEAVFRAYFADGRNIAMPDVLTGVCESVGLDPEAAGRVLLERTFRERVDADWSRARTLGISAVPTLVFRNSLLVGAQPYEKMSEFLSNGGVVL